MSVSSAIRKFLASNYLISLLVLWSTLISGSVASNLYQNQQDTIAKAKIEARTIFRHNIAYRKWSTMHGGIYTKITDKNKDNPHYLYNIDGSEKDVSFAIIDPAQVTKQAYEVLHNQAPNLAAISRTVSLDYQNTVDPYDQPDEWESLALRDLEAGKIEEASTVTTINNAPYLRLLTPYIIDRGCIKCHSHDFTIGSVRGGMSVAVPMLPYYETAVQSERTTMITHLLIWLLGCVAIVKFSSAFKKYRTTIIESEKKFRIVSEFAYNFEYWLGQDNTIVFISPSCQDLTGYSREEFISNPQLLETMMHPDDQTPFHNQINNNTSHTFSAPARIIKKNGEIRWFTHTVTPIYVDGEYLGRRGSSIDVTEQKKLEERLLHSKQLECMGQFAGGIAHDFNNVLGSINTFAHLLSEEIKDTNSTAIDYIKYIKIATKLGKNLTSNLLSFGKKQIIEPQKTSLKKIISNISDILKSLVDESFHYSFSLTEDDFEIAADPHQLEQILINLCTNARDAMQNGGVITITTRHLTMDHDIAGNLELIPADEYMVLTVSDNGHGIKPENIKKICEPFFTTKSSSKGTGLGLSIIFNIVKQHKAFMNVESVLNQGTVFSIFIKTTGRSFAFSGVPGLVAETDSSSIGPVSPPREMIALSPLTETVRNSCRKTILLADDDDLIRKALQVQLEHHGYQVILANNGKKAISLFLDQQNTIDMSILDVIMPERNGKEVSDVILKNNPDALVLFISGNTGSIISDDMIRQEGLHFMQKPIDFDLLISKVEGLIGKSGK